MSILVYYHYWCTTMQYHDSIMHKSSPQTAPAVATRVRSPKKETLPKTTRKGGRFFFAACRVMSVRYSYPVDWATVGPVERGRRSLGRDTGLLGSQRGTLAAESSSPVHPLCACSWVRSQDVVWRFRVTILYASSTRAVPGRRMDTWILSDT